MLSTIGIIGHYNGLSQNEITKLSNLVTNLAELGLNTISCHNEHHAVVMYSYMGIPITINSFGEILKKNHRITEVLSLFAINKDQMIDKLEKYKRIF